MKLIHMKLINGEEVIAQFVAYEKNVYVVKHPMIIQNIMNKSTGEAAIILHLYSPFSDINENISFAYNNIVSKVDVSEKSSMNEYYKNSLEYSVLYGVRDLDQRVAKNSAEVKEFLNARISESLGTEYEPTADEISESSLN